MNRAVMVRGQRYKVARYDEGGVELYDRERDPDELESVDQSPAYASVRRTLEAELDDAEKRHPHSPPHFSPRTEPAQRQRLEDAFRAWQTKRG